MSKVKEKYPQCNALKLTEDGYCPRPAGSGTDHRGEGRCSVHSGMANGVPVAGYKIPAIQERMHEFIHDPEIISVDREIALVRAYTELLGGYISVLQQEHNNGTHPKDSQINVAELTAMVNQSTRNIAHLVQTKHQIEMDRKYMVDIRMVHLMFTMVGDIIDKAVIDTVIRSQIGNALNRISLPAPIK